MKKIKIEADKRDVGKGECKRLRNSSFIPGILYDTKTGGKLLKLDERSVKKVFSEYGQNVVFDIDISGETVTSVVKEIQRDNLSNKITHIDFKPVELHEVIHADIPIKVINSNSAKSNGWVINRQIDHIEVEGGVDNIPESISVDISRFRAGDVIKVSDLEVSKEISIVSEQNEVVMSILKSKNYFLEDTELEVLEEKQPI